MLATERRFRGFRCFLGVSRVFFVVCLVGFSCRFRGVFVSFSWGFVFVGFSWSFPVVFLEFFLSFVVVFRVASFHSDLEK